MILRYHHEHTHTSLPFDQYLEAQYFSNSGISEIERGYPIESTAKMTLGKEVDMILANNHPGTGLSSKAIRISKKIESSVAWSVVKDSIKQPSLFGKFVLYERKAGWNKFDEYYEEDEPAFQANFKTRPDFLCRKCTVDLKVTEVKLKYLDNLITAMKYERQMWIHRTMAQVPNSFLMIHSIPDDKTVLVPVETDYEDEIMNFVILNGSGLMKKQLEVLRYLATVPCANIDDIYKNVSFSYYCNQNKHLGCILSRMVKSGKIERIKKGWFRYITAEDYINRLRNQKVDENQRKLF